jgi:hypothetical protein
MGSPSEIGSWATVAILVYTVGKDGTKFIYRIYTSRQDAQRMRTEGRLAPQPECMSGSRQDVEAQIAGYGLPQIKLDDLAQMVDQELIAWGSYENV